MEVQKTNLVNNLRLPELILNRIVQLETVGVGCGPHCVCRAYVAAAMSEGQATAVETEAKAVTFDRKQPLGEVGLSELLGPDIPEVTEMLTKIANDKKLPDRQPDLKGGVAGAKDAYARLYLAAFGVPPGLAQLISAAMGSGAHVAILDEEGIHTSHPHRA
jgi:hypothetical protein